VGAAAVAGRPGPRTTAGAGVPGRGVDRVGPGRAADAGSGVLDLGEYVCNELVSVRPAVVALTRIGSTDFGALSQQQRVDALVVIEQHRAWLDGLRQQVLAEVAIGGSSEDRWVKEEVACALGWHRRRRGRS